MTTSYADVVRDPPVLQRYRVEHHHDDVVHILGILADAYGHFRTLDPFVSRLLRSNAEGVILLVNDDTDVVVARRQVRPFRGKPRDGFRSSER
jgi:hypothetical protein